jgi:hypothetical protein
MAGNRADPVKMRGHDAVLRAGRAHADHFLRAEIGGEEGQAGDPHRVETLRLTIQPMVRTKTKYSDRIR